MRLNLLNSGAIFWVLVCSPINTANAVDLEPAWYVGGGVGASWLDPKTSNTVYSLGDDRDFGWHLSGGYRINQNLAEPKSFLRERLSAIFATVRQPWAFSGRRQ